MRLSIDETVLLAAGLEDLHRAGARLVCHDRLDWIDDRRPVRALAALECRSCPLLETCKTYADAIGPTFGVFAGTDYTPTTH